MAYAAALGSKSVSLTIPGLLGYSIPAFLFCHMTSYYVPDKIKPVFNVGKFVLGAPVWIVSELVDKGLEPMEEQLYGVNMPLDLLQTGGTSPSDLGSLDDLQEILDQYTNY